MERKGYKVGQGGTEHPAGKQPDIKTDDQPPPPLPPSQDTI